MRVHSSALPTTSAPSAEPHVKPRRFRWLRVPRRHWLTWLVLIGTSIPLFLLEVPGYGVTPTLLTAKPFQWGGSFAGPPPDPNQAEGPLFVSEFEHGWPLTYLRRAAGSGGRGWPSYEDGKVIIGLPSGSSIAPWDWTLAWRSRIDAAQWNFTYLLIDLAVAVTVVGGFVWACQAWVRRRGNRIRLRIVDFLGAMLIVGAAISWQQWHLQLQAREARFIASGPMVESKASRRPPVYNYCGPEWMARLVGDWRLPWCRHLIGVQIDAEKATPKDWQELRQMRAIREVNLVGPLTADGLAALESLPQLRTFWCAVNTPPWEDEASNASNPKLASVLQPDNLSSLLRLRHLETLHLFGRVLLIEDMNIVDQMPRLQEIDLTGILATVDEQVAFRDEHPLLTVHCYDSEQAMLGRLGGSFASQELTWRVASYRTARWRWEASGSKPINEWMGSLNLAGVRLTEEKIDRVRPVFASMDGLEVDANPLHHIKAILKEAVRLRYFYADAVEVDRELLATLAALPELEEVAVSQGHATAEDFCQLKRAMKTLFGIRIYNSTFTEREIQQIEQAIPHKLLVYRGADAESEWAN